MSQWVGLAPGLAGRRSSALALRNARGWGIERLPNQMPESPPSPVKRIFTRNRRQTMDWSLVLASQGIEHVLEHFGETGWALAVAEQDYERSLANIEQYRLENARWRWRQPIFQPGFFFDWSSAGWVLLLVIFYGWSEERGDLRNLGEMKVSALSQGEWWRLFTATWLHANVAHLAANAVFGFLFMGLVMGRYGPGLGLLAAYLAGVGGNVADWLVYNASQGSLGASGVVMGALGLLSIPPFVLFRQRKAAAFKLVTMGLLSGLLLFLFLGVSPEADVIAHFGGFVSGLLLGLLLALAPKLGQRPPVNVTAGILFVSLVVLPWLWAAARLP